jgi:5-methylcytosine-specific restriction enzyme subunit McrC
MLAYAFRSLNAGAIGSLGGENFENLHELFAEIIIRGMRRQLKRGLPKQYNSNSEELSNPRGKIDIQSTVRGRTQIRHRLVCEFDEFSEDTPANRLIKCAVTLLLRQSDISTERKHHLKCLRSCLGDVADISYRKIPPQRSGGAEYVMLVNVCRFLLEGLIMNNGNGTKMREWLPDEQMSTLYEHFLLEYFRRHYPHYNAKSALIDWDAETLPMNMPSMKSDVYLTDHGKTLIVDAKFYSRTMSQHFGKKTYHSHNLYQIFTYVKNADKEKSGNVSGMLLYAKTDEDITPDETTNIGGNSIGIRTLDLSQSFSGIRSQLDGIAGLLA